MQLILIIRWITVVSLLLCSIISSFIPDSHQTTVAVVSFDTIIYCSLFSVYVRCLRIYFNVVLSWCSWEKLCCHVKKLISYTENRSTGYLLQSFTLFKSLQSEICLLTGILSDMNRNIINATQDCGTWVSEIWILCRFRICWQIPFTH